MMSRHQHESEGPLAMWLFRAAGIGLIASALVAAPAAAEADDEAHVAHEEASSTHYMRDIKHEVAIFVGATDESGHDSEFTWGLDYRLRLAGRWAVGALYDYAGGGLRNTVLAASATYWPLSGRLQLLVAPGVELHEGRGSGEHSKSGLAEEPNEDSTEFLVRVGVAYDIHLDENFGLVPQVNLDFVAGEKVWVYGISGTYGW